MNFIEPSNKFSYYLVMNSQIKSALIKIDCAFFETVKKKKKKDDFVASFTTLCFAR